MRFLRSLSYLITLFFGTIWHGCKVILAGLLRVPNRPGGVFDQTARRWSRLLLGSAGVKVRLVGADGIPDRPVVYASNHQSWFDILAIAANIPGTVRFVSKIELARVPILGPAMRRAGHIFIDRSNRQQAFTAYEDVAGVIRDGMSAIVFPEGTRSRTGELQPFKKGPFVLAIAAQVPVVPVYCAYTFDILPKGSMLIRPHPVTVFFGKPISTEGMDYEDRQRLLELTRAEIERLRDEARRRSGTPELTAPRGPGKVPPR